MQRGRPCGLRNAVNVNQPNLIEPGSGDLLSAGEASGET